MHSTPISRRRFVAQTSLAALSANFLFAADPGRKRRAVVIGDTGHGDYGHGLDVALTGVPQVEIVAVADHDANGRVRAAQRAGAARQYEDFREMLRKEQPDLAVIAPRWSEGHHAMAMEALRAGAHLLTEKPFTATLAQADEILASAQRLKRKVAVAHQMRLAPSVVYLHRAVAEGVIGELVQMRSWGKQDSRAGGEDMLVLGTHVFDMMRLFAGDALWCSAHVTQKGHDITKADAHSVTEKIGPIAGDEIEARFGFANGITATFTSRGRLRQTLGHWGIEFLGSNGVARMLMDVFPTVYVRKGSAWKANGSTDEWRPLPGDPSLQLTVEQRGFGPANRRVVDDWLSAIDKDREPQCSGQNAMKAVEMVMAVYQAALQHRRVTIPLTQRAHPLT